MTATLKTVFGIGFLTETYRVIDHRLHWLYAALALPIVTSSALRVPPYRTPDEPAHFFRAAHIARGGLIETPEKVDLTTDLTRADVSGGAVSALDAGLIQFEEIVNETIPRAVELSQWRRAEVIRWSNSDRWLTVGATSRYGPFLYLPQAAGLFIGRTLGLTILHSFYLARILNGLCAIALSVLAIRICRRGKLFLFCVALLPMAVFLMGSMAQDAGIIALVLLAAALLSKGTEAKRTDFVLFAGIVAMLAIARLPLVGLLVLLWLPMWRARNAVNLRQQFLASAGCTLLFFGWFAATVRTQGPMPSGPGARPDLQLQFLHEHPLAILSVPWKTFQSDYAYWYTSFIGRLGWLDILLPDLAYWWAGIILLTATALCLVERSNHKLGDRLLTATAVIVTFWITLLGFYLSWTPAGAPIAQGMQGRYLFGMVPLLTIFAPHLALPQNRWVNLLTRSCVILCASILLFLAVKARLQIKRGYQPVAASAHSSFGDQTNVQTAPTFDDCAAVENTPVATGEQSNGMFRVSGTTREGTQFQNTTRKPATFKFTASGQWSFASAAGMVGPNGIDSIADNSFLVPDKNKFGLIARQQDGTYVYIGDEGEVSLKPGASAFFGMNDNGFSDNRGSLVVKWSKEQ